MAPLHHCSSNPGGTNRVEVPSFSLLTARSAMPWCFGSMWSGLVEIPGKIFASFLWTPINTQCKSLHVCFLGTDNFVPTELPNLVPPPACRWCNRDAFSSLRTLWSPALVSPYCVASGILSSRLSGFLPAWSSRDFCAFANITNGGPSENEWTSCFSLQLCSRVSLDYVEAVCWGLFHQHCRMIQNLSVQIHPSTVETNLEDLALGLLMLHLHRFGDLCRQQLPVRL